MGGKTGVTEIYVCASDLVPDVTGCSGIYNVIAGVQVSWAVQTCCWKGGGDSNSVSVGWGWGVGEGKEGGGVMQSFTDYSG